MSIQLHIIHVLISPPQATFQVHQTKNAVVTNMQCVGDGVWISFKLDSVLRLFNASAFTHMQDLDVAPSVHKLLGTPSSDIFYGGGKERTEKFFLVTSWWSVK